MGFSNLMVFFLTAGFLGGDLFLPEPVVVVAAVRSGGTAAAALGCWTLSSPPTAAVFDAGPVVAVILPLLQLSSAMVWSC